jgi:hypothetical protein
MTCGGLTRHTVAVIFENVICTALSTNKCIFRAVIILFKFTNFYNNFSYRTPKIVSILIAQERSKFLGLRFDGTSAVRGAEIAQSV